MLRYRTGHLRHAGIAIGLNGAAGRIFDGCPPGWHGYFDDVVRNWSAVDGAALMVSAATFEAAGRFDESLDDDIAAADLCLQIGRLGKLVVYTSHAELVVGGHREVATAQDRLPAAWAELFEHGDPFFHPALSLVRAEMRLAAAMETGRREAQPLFLR